MEIQLKHGLAVFDDADFELVIPHVWRSMKSPTCRDVFYAYACINGRTVYMHRLIMDAAEGQEVDHRNRDGLNNLRSNLRFCTSSQNKMNQRVRRDNSSGRKGVSWQNSRRKWVAYIQIEKKRIPLGRFDNFEDAVAVRLAAEQRHYGEFARAA